MNKENQMNENQQKNLMGITKADLLALQVTLVTSLAFDILVFVLWLDPYNKKTFYINYPVALLAAANFLEIIITVLCFVRKIRYWFAIRQGGE